MKSGFTIYFTELSRKLIYLMTNCDLSYLRIMYEFVIPFTNPACYLHVEFNFIYCLENFSLVQAV